MAFWARREGFMRSGRRSRGSGIGSGVVELSIFGDEALQMQLDALQKQAKPIVRRAFRRSAKRLRTVIAARTPIKSGTLKREMKRAKIVSVGGRKRIRIGIAMPTRESLGIPPNAKGYYPAAIEFGSVTRRIAARSYIRGSVDAMEAAEIAAIGSDIGRQIYRASLR